MLWLALFWYHLGSFYPFPVCYSSAHLLLAVSFSVQSRMCLLHSSGLAALFPLSSDLYFLANAFIYILSWWYCCSRGLFCVFGFWFYPYEFMLFYHASPEQLPLCPIFLFFSSFRLFHSSWQSQVALLLPPHWQSVCVCVCVLLILFLQRASHPPKFPLPINFAENHSHPIPRSS